MFYSDGASQRDRWLRCVLDTDGAWNSQDCSKGFSFVAGSCCGDKQMFCSPQWLVKICTRHRLVRANRRNAQKDSRLLPDCCVCSAKVLLAPISCLRFALDTLSFCSDHNVLSTAAVYLHNGCSYVCLTQTESRTCFWKPKARGNAVKRRNLLMEYLSKQTHT